MSKVVFTCKDPQITRHCEQKFGRRFQQALDGGADRDALARRFTREVTREARRQQWFEWIDTDEDQTNWQGKVIGKKREVVRNPDGTPKLLVPDIEIESDE